MHFYSADNSKYFQNNQLLLIHFFNFHYTRFHYSNLNSGGFAYPNFIPTNSHYRWRELALVIFIALKKPGRPATSVFYHLNFIPKSFSFSQIHLETQEWLRTTWNSSSIFLDTSILQYLSNASQNTMNFHSPPSNSDVHDKEHCKSKAFHQAQLAEVKNCFLKAEVNYYARNKFDV